MIELEGIWINTIKKIFEIRVQDIFKLHTGTLLRALFM